VKAALPVKATTPVKVVPPAKPISRVIARPVPASLDKTLSVDAMLAALR
jgi:hypothetical protein